jgi:hypothetical protein
LGLPGNFHQEKETSISIISEQANGSWRMSSGYQEIHSFLFMDQELDIYVEPGLSRWEWKDEEHLQKAQADGRFRRVR